MTEPVRVARQSRVAECQDLLAIGPLLVHPEDDLLEIVRLSSAQPATRTLGVVDDEGRIVGIIRVIRLTESVVARIAPEAIMVGIHDAEAVGRFARAIEDRVARDIMEPPATISPDATVAEAFREMHRNQLTGMYVVDPAGRPIGYVDMMELTLCLADALEEEPAEAGPAEAGPAGPSNSGTGPGEQPTGSTRPAG